MARRGHVRHAGLRLQERVLRSSGTQAPVVKALGFGSIAGAGAAMYAAAYGTLVQTVVVASLVYVCVGAYWWRAWR